MEVFAILNQEASTVSNVFMDEIFMCYVIPKQLHSDQGLQFESCFFGSLQMDGDSKEQNNTLSSPM